MESAFTSTKASAGTSTTMNGDHSQHSETSRSSSSGGGGGGGGGMQSASSLASPPFTPQNLRRTTSGEEDDDDSSAKKAKIPWTPEEDEILRKAVEMYKGRAWKQVAELLPGRTHSQAAHRWQKVLDPKLKKGTWTQEEDDQLQKAVEDLGEGHWSRVAERVGSRNGKQCRERWRNQISPEVDKRPWLPEEDEGIIRLFTELGPKWAEIAKHFPGRTENAVKNRWNAKLGRPNGSSSSAGGSPATPNPSKRHHSSQGPGSAMSSRSSTVATETPKRGRAGRDARTRSSAASAASAAASSPGTPGGGYSAFSSIPLSAMTMPGLPLSPGLIGNGHHHHHHQSSSPLMLGGLASSNGNGAHHHLRSSAFPAAMTTTTMEGNGLPPLPLRKRNKLLSSSSSSSSVAVAGGGIASAPSAGEQMDATQALLALRAGSSPGW